MNRHAKTISPIFVLFLLALTACRSGEQKDLTVGGASSKETTVLEKLDSIRIGYLGNPTVHDLDPVNRRIIFMDHREFSEDIHIADFDGNILQSFSKFGDKPDSYGGLMGTLKLTDPNRFLVYGYRGFLTFDMEGRLESLVKYNDFHVPSQSRRGMGYGLENLGQQYLFIHQGPPPQDLQEYRDFRLFTLLDPQQGTREPIIGFPEESRFLNGNHFFFPCWFPVFTVDLGRIYAAFGVEPVIYVYETSYPFALVDRIPLDLPNYSGYEGSEDPSDIRVLGMCFISGKIENIKKMGNLLLIGYFPGYDEKDIATNFENKTQEETEYFQASMRRKYLSRIAVVDSLGNVLNDFVPDGLDPSSMLLRDGQLWMMEKRNEDQEQDYFRLFRVGLKVEKN